MANHVNSEFIPIFNIPSDHTDGKKQTILINKNAISCYSHFKIKGNECLQLAFDYNKLQGTAIPRKFVICKETNPIAFHSLFQNNIQEKLQMIDEKEIHY